VDVGPPVSAGRLLESLAALNVDRLDWIFLTHAHIDHAGAVASVLERYPTARAVVFAQAVKHLVDPTRLWAGSLQVLGDLARAYCPPPPVPADRLVAHDQMDLPGLTIIETPGHAPHHLSYAWQGRLYSGEAAGNLLEVQGRSYLRPATPHRFFLPEAVASVDKMLALPDQPIYYAHYESAPSSLEMLGRFRRQLLRWEEIIKSESTRAGAGTNGDLKERCVDALLERDEEIAAFPLMDPAEQARERSFIGNSVKGYLGYLEEARG
jgi:glyoxylase-like metal-dependent hydrolase (beta-lactamase superfamily II)